MASVKFPSILPQPRVIALAIAFLASSCGSKESTTKQDPPSQERQEEKEEASGFEAPSLLGMTAMFSQLGKPGLYDAPRESVGFSGAAPHMLTMDLSGQVSELETFSIWGGTASLELRALQNRLREIAANTQVKGLLLRTDGLVIGMAAAQELRATLKEFKGDGARSLHCHAEGASNVTYYLMSACDSIGLAPTGQLVISGVAAMPLHLKGLLDKLGIKADFLHVGDYKGAAEPLTLDKPSDAMNETIGAILDQGYSAMVDGIAEGRKLPPETVRALIDTAMFSDKAGMKAKLVDSQATYEAFRTQVAGDLPWKKTGLKEEKQPGLADLMDLVGLQPRTRSGSEHVAVVYAVGNIIDGAGGGILGARQEIASHTLSAALHALAGADSVKAVVLRVDSGGGSALASELIWHAMEEVKANKPVVVSMGGVAASGGYYISAGANRIYADANTLTGSIGVVGGKLAIGGALEKIGVTSFPVGRGKHSMMWSSLGSWNQEERAIVQQMMEDIYKVFVQRVADGRGKSYEDIHKLAQGRVWTGKAALDNGLVDEIGGLDAAIAHATKLAGMESSGDLEIYPPQPRLTDFLLSLAPNVSASESLLLAEATQLLGPKAAQVIQHSLRQVRSFQEAQLQTTLLLPVIW